jgi:hypothetical protein
MAAFNAYVGFQACSLHGGSSDVASEVEACHCWRHNDKCTRKGKQSVPSPPGGPKVADSFILEK